MISTTLQEERCIVTKTFAPQPNLSDIGGREEECLPLCGRGSHGGDTNATERRFRAARALAPRRFTAARARAPTDLGHCHDAADRAEIALTHLRLRR